MPGMPAGRPEAQTIDWQRQVIHDGQGVFERYPGLLQPVFERPAAEVHIGCRANANKLFALPTHLCMISETVNSQLAAMLLHKGIDDIEPDIVTGIRIFVTGIAQTNK